jgi:Prokaryotic E2 family E
MIDSQLTQLVSERKRDGAPEPTARLLPNGGYLITIPGVDIGQGWSERTVTVLFVAPPGYPAARPDCFWVEPCGLRVAGGGTPQNTNDSNAIPGDDVPGRRTTWFSWHLQTWNPNTDSLLTFYHVIMNRLIPAR